jgi:hypothetical protein
LVNTKKPENWTVREQLAGKPRDKTRFAAIAEDRLGITLIPAHTPQAKGRVERLWEPSGTASPSGCALKASPIWIPRAALPRFIEAYNARFSVRSADAGSAFVPLTSGGGLDTLLCVRHERTTDNYGRFSFQNLLFQAGSDRPPAKRKSSFSLAGG